MARGQVRQNSSSGALSDHNGASSNDGTDMVSFYSCFLQSSNVTDRCLISGNISHSVV